MDRRVALRALVATVALTISTTMPSAAGSKSARDPSDVHGPVDVRRIEHGHGDDGLLWHKVVMWNRWGAKDLHGNDEIRFHFSYDGEDRYDEVHASVAVKNGKLAAWVFPYVEGSDYASVGPSERIRFTRPTRYSVKIFFDKGWVDVRDRYVWSVGSSYRNRDSKNCREACFDYAPGNNPDRLEHNL